MTYLSDDDLDAFCRWLIRAAFAGTFLAGIGIGLLIGWLL